MSKHHRKRGWNSTTSRYWRTRIAPSLPLPCTKCRRPVYADQPWDVDHILSLSKGGLSEGSNIGPAHQRCNRSAGGKEGNTKRHGPTVRDERGDPEW